MPEDHQRPSTVPWPPLLLTGAIGLGIAIGTIAPVPLFGGPASRYGGMLLATAAVVLDVVAVLTLLSHQTAVMPHRASDALVTTGPFALSRNPIYLGNVLLTAGLAFALDNAWLVAGTAVEAVLLQRLAIAGEERHLEARFGGAWRVYRAKTSRWLGPGARSGSR